jgi:hypothetical protein
MKYTCFGLLFDLLGGRRNEDGSLSETGLGLEEDIVSELDIGDVRLVSLVVRIKLMMGRHSAYC